MAIVLIMVLVSLYALDIISNSLFASGIALLMAVSAVIIWTSGYF